jgi:hypothetical protein
VIANGTETSLDSLAALLIPRRLIGAALIVIHTAEGATTIESLGAWFQNPSAGVSSHAGADDKPNTIGEFVARGNKAWTAAEFNPVAVQIELCGFAAWTSADWDSHPNMLANCAAWIRDEAQHFGIPITKLSAAEAQGSGRGVCQHADLGARGGGHWDCGGGFPIDHVLDMARSGTSAPPTPVPAPEQEDHNMVASGTTAAGNLHVFVANADKLRYTWQRPNETSWAGGQPGKGPAGLQMFADAPAEIVGVSCSRSDTDVFHVWVKLIDGRTLYTWQRPGETSWQGGQAGVSPAGLTLFAPKP